MKSIRRLIIVVLLVVLLTGTWLTTEWLLFRRTIPPASVTDVNSFLNWQPGAGQFTILSHSDGEYLMATGPGGGLVPSGPSAYVFDRSGRLVDWSPDIGDRPRFDERWQAQRGTGKSLARSEVLEWIAPGATP